MLLKIDTNEIRSLNYSRRDALIEGAILPIEFRFGDGPVSFLEKDEANIVSLDRLSQAPKDKQSAALRTGLTTGLAKGLLDQCLQHFHMYRQNAVPTAKLLVIAASQLAAEKIHRYLLGKEIDAALAISDEGKEAKACIQRFKNDANCFCLVTCAMAYEGLDVPEISHIAFLTNYRSKPWLEQSFGRAVRINPREFFTEQQAFVFLPRDPLAVRVVEEIEKDQNEFLKIREKTESGRGGCGPTDGDFTPISSELLETYAADFDSLRTPVKVDAETAMNVVPIPLPPKQQEEALRKRIDTLSKKIAWRLSQPFEQFNRYLKNKFGKSRTHMTLAELGELCAYLESYKLEKMVRKGGTPHAFK